MDKQLLQRALDALVAMQAYAWQVNSGLRICDEAIDELRAAIDAPEVEQKHVGGKWCADLHCNKCYSADFRFKHAPPDTEAKDAALRAALEALQHIQRCIGFSFAQIHRDSATWGQCEAAIAHIEALGIADINAKETK